MNRITVSRTAVQLGFGTHPHKRVVGLTGEERQALREGATMLFRSTALSGGNHGTYWRKILYWRDPIYARDRYQPRVPSAEEIAQAKATGA